MKFDPLYHDLRTDENSERMRDFLGLFIFIVVLVFYILRAFLIKQLFHLRLLVLVLHALFLFIALFFRNLIANLVFVRIKTHVGCDNYQNCSTTS